MPTYVYCKNKWFYHVLHERIHVCLTVGERHEHNNVSGHRRQTARNRMAEVYHLRRSIHLGIFYISQEQIWSNRPPAAARTEHSSADESRIAMESEKPTRHHTGLEGKIR